MSFWNVAIPNKQIWNWSSTNKTATELYDSVLHTSAHFILLQETNTEYKHVNEKSYIGEFLVIVFHRNQVIRVHVQESLNKQMLEFAWKLVVY